MKIKFDCKTCIGCFLCALSCQWQKTKTRGLGESDLRIYWSNDRWVIEVDEGECAACGKCVEDCPRSCLELENET